MNTVSPLQFSKREILLFSLLLLGALLIRLWELGSLPNVFFHDEWDLAANVRSILLGQGPGVFDFNWVKEPALVANIKALFLSWLSPSLFSLRAGAAVFSTIALVPMYLLLRRRCSLFISLVMVLLLSTYPGYLHFSRAAWSNIYVSVCDLSAALLLLLALSTSSLRRRQLLTFCAGMSAGAAFLTYFAGRATILSCVGLLYAHYVFYSQHKTSLPLSLRTLGKNLSALVIGFALVISPLFYTHSVREVFLPNRVLVATSAIQENSQRVAGFNAMEQLTAPSLDIPHNIATSFKAFFIPSEHSSRYFSPHHSMAFGMYGFLFTGLLLWLALRLVKRKGTNPVSPLWMPEIASALFFFAVPFALSQWFTKDTPNFARVVPFIPHLFILFGFLLSRIQEELNEVRTRVLFSVVVSIAAAITVVESLTIYIQWVGSQEFAEAIRPAKPSGAFKEWWVEKRL